jgi:predicted patatin/cPLA2 family phospholipase
MSSDYVFIKNYKGICISSGGIAGSTMLGMLHFISERFDILKNVKYFAGTSAGSLISLLLIIGYTPMEILTYICSNDISKIFKFSLDNISNNFGIYDINNFKEYMTKMLLNKIDKIPTFLELYNNTSKIFLCCSYCVTKKSRQYYSYKHTPDLSVLEGVIRSSAIPLILTKYQEEENIYLDGALFDHFPILKLINTIKSHEENFSNIKILGINVVTTKMNHIKSYNDYVNSILNIFIDIQNKEEDNEYLEELKDKGNLDIIELTKEFNFSITDNVKQRIESFCNGIQLAKNHFKINKTNKIKFD